MKNNITYKTIGKKIKRVDALVKVTGLAKYTGDLKFPNELFGKVVRSSIPHGIIKKIDFKESLKVKDVVGVVTGENTTEKIGVCIQDQPPIARQKVRFVGEPVAVVVAKTKEAALEGALKVKVEYEELPAVFSCREAMKENAPILHDDFSVIPGFYPIKGTNIFHYYKIRVGDIEKVFKEAKYIIKGKIDWPHLSHCQMEPHVTIAKWGFDNKIEIYTSAQSPCDVRHFIGEIFHHPLKDIEVVTHCVGGGFGGKSDVTIEPLTVLVAKNFKGNYIRIQLDREEMFYGTVVGRGLESDYEVAFNEDGKIQGLKVKYMLNGGAYASFAINIVQPGGIVTTGTYYVPNIKVDAYGVYTNKPLLGAFRAYGHPEGVLIIEKIMDEIAYKLKKSPIEIRKKNLIKVGQKNSIGQEIKYDDGNIKKCMELVEKDLEKYKNTQPESSNLVRGVGIANLLKAPGMPPNGFSTAIIKMNEDATFSVIISGIDMGQGLLTVISQIAAEALLTDISKIDIINVPNTRYTPYEWQTVASRSTWMLGNAVYKAAQDLIYKLKQNAAIALNKLPEDMEYDGEKVYYKYDKDRYIPIEKLTLGYTFSNGITSGMPPVGYGAYVPEMEFPDPDTGQGNLASQWTFGTQGVVLDVDIETGEIYIRAISSALDIGRVINPELAKGQVEGGVVMGIGGAILEAILYDEKGRIRNDGFTDYKIPTPEDILDIDIKTHFVETPDNTMIYGAKCLGEHPIIAIAPAIMSALTSSLGITFDSLPLTSEKIRLKIKEKNITKSKVKIEN